MIPYADLRKQPRMDLAASIPLSVPLTIYVEPTNVCNLSCGFCPQSLDDYKERAGYHQHMPLSLFSRLMDEIKEMRIKSLKLYFFGEPLMHPEIGQMCRLAAEACDRVELTTNLIPLTPAKAVAIIESGIHYIRVSWYGESPDRVRRNLAFLHELKLARHQTKPHVAVKFLSSAEIVPDVACDEIITEQLHTISSDFVHLRSYEENKQACPHPFYSLIVKSNGDAVPCCVAWDETLVVGNANQSSLAELWRSPKLEEIRLTHLRGERASLSACAHCDQIFASPDSVDSVSSSEYLRRLG